MDTFEAFDALAMDSFEVFDAVAQDLMLKQGVKQSELHKRLRNINQAASKGLLPLQILYCNSYGGYNYSKEFSHYLQAKRAIPDSLATLCALQFGANSDFGTHSNSDSDSDSESDPDSISHSNPDSASHAIFHSDPNLDFKCYGSRRDRIRHAQWITPFGQHVMEKWPGIAKLVKAYMKNDLGHQMDDIEKIAWYRERLCKYVKIRNAIAADTGRSDGKPEYSIYLLNEETDYSVYTPSALKEMDAEVDAKQSKFILDHDLDIQNTHNALLTHMTKAQYEAMLQSLDTKDVTLEAQFDEDAKAWYTAMLQDNQTQYEAEFFAMLRSLDTLFDEDGEAAQAQYAAMVQSLDTKYDAMMQCLETHFYIDAEERYQVRRLSFIDAIAQYGEHHYAVWRHQKYFNQKAMCFLLSHPEYTEQLASEADNVYCTRQLGLRELGLCAASGSHCTLQIAKVPCMVEWKVDQHDGLESVQLL